MRRSAPSKGAEWSAAAALAHQEQAGTLALVRDEGLAARRRLLML
jgi:hypothetical protein